MRELYSTWNFLKHLPWILFVSLSKQFKETSQGKITFHNTKAYIHITLHLNMERKIPFVNKYLNTISSVTVCKQTHLSCWNMYIISNASSTTYIFTPVFSSLNIHAFNGQHFIWNILYIMNFLQVIKNPDYTSKKFKSIKFKISIP